MKRTIKLNWKTAATLVMVLVGVLFDSCQKEDAKAVINPPSDVSMLLTTTSATLVLDSTQASSTTAATLSWNALSLGVQVSVNYTLEIDSIQGDFTNATLVNMGDSLSRSYTKAALNLIALNLKLVPAVAGQIQFRVKAVVGTGYPPVFSKAVPITITPYSLILPPKYPVPDSLYIVGSATDGAWNNPVPIQAQHFTKIDYKSFGIVVQLTGGQQYLLLPVNGSWAHKYAISAATSNPAGDVFAPDAANNITGPANSGLYQIIVDFVKGTYTATAVAVDPIPVNLFIVGDATAGGWNNPVPIPSQQFKQLSCGEYTISVSLLATGSYLFLPKNGDWAHKFGGASASGGVVLADGNVPNSNTPGPGVAGNYSIYVNFFTNQYTVTKQ